MKTIIVVALAFAAVAVAAPADDAPPIILIRSDFQHTDDGGYHFVYETSNGVVRDETGQLKEVLNEEGQVVRTIVVTGSITVPGEDGSPITTNYVANENGFEATGPLIPKVAEELVV